jgi:hypothetical protein
MKDQEGRIVRLKRIATSEERGTFGVLLDDQEPFCVTLEPPLILQDDGKTTPSISCIPAGIYISSRVDSPRFGKTFEVKDVEGGHRTHILFHKGNATKDTLGCLLLAEGFGSAGVERSTQGYKEFMGRLKDCEHFVLQITEEYE